MFDDELIEIEEEVPLYFLAKPTSDHGYPPPQRGTEQAAGYDLRTVDGVELEPGERQLIGTGFAIRLPLGTYGRIAPRSGLAVKYGVDCLAGVVDSDYRGEVKVLLINHGDDPVTFYPGDRIAQLVITPVCNYLAPWIVDDLDQSDSERGTGGFGSTGVH